MPIDHDVRQGDCISSIAADHGFFPETLRDHPNNAELKELRGDMNVLLPGDVVHVPDLREQEESRGSDSRHKFKRKGVPEILRIVLKDLDDQPRTGLDYTAVIDDKEIKGKTDGDGALELSIPPAARSGKLVIGDDDSEVYELELGHTDPIEETSGVQARLKNLGFEPGSLDGQLGDKTKEALIAFQRVKGLDETGEADDATRQALVDAHQS